MDEDTHTYTHARARTRTPSPKLIKISRQIQSAAAASGQRRPPAAEKSECQRLDTVTFIRHLGAAGSSPSRQLPCARDVPSSFSSQAPHLPSV